MQMDAYIIVYTAHDILPICKKKKLFTGSYLQETPTYHKIQPWQILKNRGDGKWERKKGRREARSHNLSIAGQVVKMQTLKL